MTISGGKESRSMPDPRDGFSPELTIRQRKACRFRKTASGDPGRPIGDLFQRTLLVGETSGSPAGSLRGVTGIVPLAFGVRGVVVEVWGVGSAG
jgi:hypothetical protein